MENKKRKWGERDEEKEEKENQEEEEYDEEEEEETKKRKKCAKCDPGRDHLSTRKLSQILKIYLI